MCVKIPDVHIICCIQSCCRKYRLCATHLHGLDVIPQVEVGIPQLAVDGRQGPEVVSPRLQQGSSSMWISKARHLESSLEEGHPVPALARLAQLLPLQGQLQAGVVITLGHPDQKDKVR